MTDSEPEEKATNGPMTGIRVLDVATILAGPLAAQVLGDFGAEVIKIEHPLRGDGLRSHGLAKDGEPLWWKMVSRNKQTLGLDLGVPEGAELFRLLVREADVVIENFRPGTLERWGLGYDVLASDNPGLVLLRVTGFGQSGPYASRPAFGTLLESMSGFAHLTGQPDGPPTLPPFGLADSIAGVAGACAVAMALYRRTFDGAGQVIDLDLLSPIMTAVGPGLLYADQLGIDQMRTGNRSTNNAPRNTYRSSDGHWMAVSTSANSVAERVMRLVGHPEVIDEPWFASGRGRAQHADLLDRYVGDWIAERTRDVVEKEFARAEAAIAPIYKPSDILADPQVNHLKLVTTVEDDDLGRLRMQNVMWRMSRTPGAIRSTGRSLGADTDALLAAIGVDDEARRRLREDGVIA